MEKKTVGHVNLWEEKELESYLLGFQIFLQSFFKCCIQGVGPESCAGTQRKVIKQATLHLDKEHTAVGRPSEVSLPNFKLQKPKASVTCGLVIGKEKQWRLQFEARFLSSLRYLSVNHHITRFKAIFGPQVP